MKLICYINVKEAWTVYGADACLTIMAEAETQKLDSHPNYYLVKKELRCDLSKWGVRYTVCLQEGSVLEWIKQ